MTAIHVEQLTKIYHLYDSPQARLKEALHPFRKKFHHDFYALNNVSFEVQQGEVLGIIGKNGCGKSTLLKILAGVLTPTSGTVTVNGSVSALLELGGGFNPEFTGLENVYFSSAIMGYTREQVEKNLDDILAFADIGEFIHQPVKTYSSGMYVRLAFAVAINVEPDVLIVDEALSVGDIRFQQKCYRKILGFKDSGKSIIFVTHDTGAVINFCDRAIWLQDGEILYEGSPDDTVKRYVAYMAYDAVTEERKMSKKLESVKLPEPSGQIVSGIDALSVGERCIDISGWAFIQGESAEDCEIYLVLKSQTHSLIFSTQRVTRRDVTEAYSHLQCNLDDSGFSVLLPKETIVPDHYTIGLYLKKETVEALRYTQRMVCLTGSEAGDARSVGSKTIQWQDVSECSSFGEGGAEIKGVAVYTKEPYQQARVLQSGERIVFFIDIQICSRIDFPVIGFIMNDEYGNHILGTNTVIERIHVPALNRGERLLVQFEFQLPWLRNGKFSFNPAIAEGTQDIHVQHHWVHDTYFIQIANPDRRWHLGHYFVLNDVDTRIMTN